MTRYLKGFMRLLLAVRFNLPEKSISIKHSSMKTEVFDGGRLVRTAVDDLRWLGSP
jgi:hypothetical protein